MAQRQRDREQHNRERNRSQDYERNQNRDYNRGQNQEDDWASQVPWNHWEGPYRDYGWERGESALPGFREPDIHFQPYEREEVEQWHNLQWNQEYNYGQVVYGPYTGVGPKGYQRSDERIMEDVCERLTQHGQIDARDIEVNVQNGEVTLAGNVDSRQTKRMAEQVVDSVRGVKDVNNQLHIQQQQGQGQRNQSGMPGGGKGRVDRVGGSGVYPVSGPMPDENAPVQGEASWGQGDRGAAGYEDSGRSEIINPQQGANQQTQQGKQNKK